jgi:hypothetical protein
MPSDEDIEAVIRKGGSTPTEHEQADEASQTRRKAQNILVQVPVLLLEKIDSQVEENLLYSSRSQWIREAMMEKLQKMG